MSTTMTETITVPRRRILVADDKTLESNYSSHPSELVEGGVS